MDILTKAPLGKKSSYHSTYSPEILFPIPRKSKREEIGVPEKLPFHGVDIWMGFELSWLNPKGKPKIGIAEFTFPCESRNIIESKSFKLYLNSFNQAKFESTEEVRILLEADLSQGVGADVLVRILEPDHFGHIPLGNFSGDCLDDLDIEVDRYEVDPGLLQVSSEIVEEKLYSHILKSNCLVTGQPDWGSVWIHYKGPKVDHGSLLRYLISFRQHNEFHEQCIERIFMDMMRQCGCEKLSVYGRYTRRGGLDINPFRSNFEKCPGNIRLARQ